MRRAILPVGIHGLLALSTALAISAQELPERFQGKKLETSPPEGYEFPLDLSDAFADRRDASGTTLTIALRAKELPKEFLVREIVFENARVDGEPARIAPYAVTFSTHPEGPVELPYLPITWSAEKLSRAVTGGSASVRFEADAYVWVSPTMVEALRFFSTNVVLHFPIEADVRLVRPEQEVSTFDLARHYSPIVYQETNDPRKDFITRFDFDGNWTGNDNEDHLDDFPLEAYVYYSVVESQSHYFLGYFFFHPVDYTKVTGPACGFFNRVGGHENDLEGVQLVVEKDGSPYGKLLAMETLAHDFIYQLENDDRVRDRREVETVVEDIDGHVETETDETGHHPRLYIECLGHGVWGYGHNGKEVGPEDRYVLYRWGEEAQEPEHQDDHDVSYQLIDVFHPEIGLWAHRDQLGEEGQEKTYAAPEGFWDGFRYGRRLGSAFYSDGGIHARPPWGWQAKGTRRGDWFLAPAFTFGRHLSIPGLGGDSLSYVLNPYLRSGGTNPALDGQQPIETSVTAPEADGSPEAPPESMVLAEATRLLLENRELIENIDSLESLLTAGETILVPLASDLLNVEAEEASRISFRYPSLFGLESVRLYWRTEEMETFDEDHSIRLRLSTKPGWHWQSVELLEIDSFDPSATIAQFKLELEIDRDRMSWSFTPAELVGILRDMSDGLGFRFGASEYTTAPPPQ